MTRTGGLWVFLLAVAVALPGLGQEGTIPKIDFSGDLGKNGLGLPRTGGDDSFEGSKVEWSARYQYDQAAKKAKVSVTAAVAEGWHVYSVTQGKKDGLGPQATRFFVQSDALGDRKALEDGKATAQYFKPSNDPETHIDQEAWPGLKIEEHEGRVTWTALLDLAEGVDPEQAAFNLTARGQVCKTDGACIPFKEAFELTFGGYVEAPAADGQFQTPQVSVEGFAEPAAAAPGATVKIVLKATPAEGWHIYAREASDPEHADGRGKPTLVVLSKLDGLTLTGIESSVQPKVKPSDGVVGEQRYYEGPVTFTVSLAVPRNLPEGSKTVAGYLAFQACDKESCVAPKAARFEVTLEQGTAPPGSQTPLQFSEVLYKEAATAAQSSSHQAAAPLDVGQLLAILGFGILGGLILNLMPCVLPVIGLKVLSFAEQGGQSRGRVFALNLVYSAGLILVFLVLATLAALPGLNLGWGEQFTYTWFKVAMIGLVFAMALSFLGIWEIPIPGFVGSGATNKLQSQEGLSGAFFKGIFTTILATPCSGPFLGSVFGFTLGQPWYIVYLVFFSVGLGMALPYLVIGVQPSLVKWLPKPGEWMDTFKHIMGFVLLGTVVYLFTTINKDYFIPALTMVVGIWFGCWWIGRVPVWSELADKVKGWAVGVSSVAVVTAAAFYFLAPWPHLYEWKPYSSAALAKAQAEGKTVMVDFTANWCQTCQWNFHWAINTYAVKDVIEQNGVEPMLADWTEPSDDIEAKLADFKLRSIPVLAIYPANRPGEVIVLKDVVTQSQLVEALKQAGPSQPEGVANAADAQSSPRLLSSQ